MAGIGWKLERMLERDTLGSTLQAYLTGIAVTSAPWLLTTAVLVTLRVIARDHIAAEVAAVEHTITITYAVTLVLSAPIHVVVSRFAADRLFERRLDQIAAPLRRALTTTIAVFLVVGVVTMLALQAPLEHAVPGALLAALVAAQWLLLSVGGGMSSPAGVLGAFAAGAGGSVLLALALERGAGLGARGYLIGFTLGQGGALLGMLHQVLLSLPGKEAPVAPGALWRAVREYRLLALAAFAVQVAVWIDKLAVWAWRGPDAAEHLAAVTALAWFTVVPTFAWIYVQVETGFYNVFRRYYRGIETGAHLGELEASAVAVRTQAHLLMRGAAAIQVAVTVLALIGAPHIVRAAGLGVESTLAFRLSLGAASLQVLTLLGLLLLYYLDLRAAALRVALLEVASIGLATAIAAAWGVPVALGAACGSLAPAIAAFAIVRRSVASLVRDTFQRQPY